MIRGSLSFIMMGRDIVEAFKAALFLSSRYESAQSQKYEL